MKRFINNYKSLCLSVFSFLTFFNVEADIKIMTECANSKLTLVDVSGVKHAGEGSDITYTISSTENDSLTFEAVLLKDGLSYKTCKGDNKDNVKKFDNLPVGAYCLEGKATLIQKIQQGDSIIYKYDTLTISAQKITLWPNPKASTIEWGTGTSATPQVCWENTIKTFSGKTEGGYTEGWTSEFVKEGPTKSSEVGLSFSTILESENTKTSNIIIFSAQNYAPDGSTVWYDYSDTCYYNVWPQATAELETSFTQKYNLYNGESLELMPLTAGGDSANWTFSWTRNGVIVCTESSYKATAENKSKSSPKCDTIKVSITNSPAGISDAFQKELSYKIISWPSPSASISAQGYPNKSNTIVLFSNAELKLDVTTSGGDTSRWTYSWNGEPEDKISSYEYIPKINSGNDTVTVIAHNELATAGEVFDTTIVYTSTIWPLPQVKREESANEISYRYNGDSIALSPVMTGGDEGKWTSIWKKNGINYSSKKNIVTQAVNTSEESPVLDTYVATFFNSPEQIWPEPFSDSLSYQVYSYKNPSASLSSISDNNPNIHEKVIFSNEADSLYVLTFGGDQERWSFVSQGITSNSGYKYSPSISSGTETITIKAHNELIDETQVFDTTMVYIYKIWPEPVVCRETSVQEMTNLYNGESIVLKPITGGGDEGKWTYSWTKNGTVVSTESSYNAFADNNSLTSPAIDTIKVVAKNAPDGIREAFLYEIRYLITIWPTPSASICALGDANKKSSRVIFSNETEELVVTPSGGDDSRWTYSWNGESAGKIATFSYLPKYSNGNDTVKVIAHNELATAGEAFDTTIVYTFTIWPAPMVEREDAIKEISYRYNGDSITLSPVMKGGDVKKWAVEWKKNGVKYSSKESIAILADNTSNNSPVLDTYIVKFTNSPDQIREVFTDSLSYQIYSYKNPSASLSSISDNNPDSHEKVLFSNEGDSLYVSTFGGDQERWSYVSQGISSNRGYKYLPSISSGTETITIKAHNELPDKAQTFDTTFVYTYKIWSAPSIARESNLEPSTHRYNNQSVCFGPVCYGGDSGNWKYVWSKDGEEYSKDSSITLTAKNALEEGPVKNTYVLVAENKPEGIRKEFRQSIAYDLISWPQPSASICGNDKNTKVYNKVLFSNESQDLEITPKGGDPSGWEYTWLDSSKYTSNSYFYQPKIEQGEELITAIASNKLQSAEVRYDTTLVYKFRIWPTPSVEISAPTDIVEGDTIIVRADSRGGQTTRWTYSWDGGETTSDSIYKNKATVDGIKEGYTTRRFALKAFNNPDGTSYESGLIECQVRVYPKPGSGRTSEAYFESCGGRSISLGVSHHGGDPDGWSCSWSDPEGKTIGDQYQTTLELENTTSEIQTRTYTARLKNVSTHINDVWFDSIQTFTVVVYPEPTVQPSFEENRTYDYFFADTVNLIVSANGGDSEQWRYEWSEEKILGTDAKYVLSVDTSECVRTYNVHITNTHKDIVWYDRNLSVNIKSYSRGNAFSEPYKSVIYHGWKAQFDSQVEGGYPAGWSYYWINPDGNVISGENLSSYDCLVKNTGNEIRTEKYTLVCTTQIGSNIGNVIQVPYTINVYPKAAKPEQESFYRERRQVRDIDGGILRISLGDKGNPDGWYYKWNTSSFIKDIDSCEVKYEDIPGDIMDYKDLEYNLTWKNVNPIDSNEIWEEGSFTFPVRIYNTPEQPGITLKGNGNSNIYIATGLSIDDEQLFNSKYAYNFLFGDGVDNIIALSEESSQRWYRYDKEPSNPWVCSCWHYSDGYECQSNRSSMQGDLGTRGILTLELTNLSIGNVKLYSIEGVILRKSMSGKRILENLNTGFYILETDGRRKVIYVK